MTRGRVVVVILCALVLATSVSAVDSKKEFVGSEKCMACHIEQYKSWRTTFHSKIVQPRKGGILKDAVAKWAADGKNPGPTTANITGRPVKLDDVQYVIGSNWKQRYLVKNNQTGGLELLNKQFNRLSGE